MRTLLLFLIIFCCGSQTFAIYTEIGISASSKQSTLDSNNYEKTESAAAELSFYFWQNSGLEFTFTEVRSQQKLYYSPTDIYTVNTQMQLVSADFIISPADRKAAFQPYIKFGAANIYKKTQQIIKDPGGFEDIKDIPPGIVPSAGAGLKLMLTEQFALKLGVDWWSIKTDTGDKANDYVGRVGLSWIF